MYRESNYADMSDIQDIAIPVPVRECEKCLEQNCKKCNLDKEACIQCLSWYVLLDGKCLKVCPETHGQHLIYDIVLSQGVKTCVTCESMGLKHCTRCSSSTTCTECTKGLFLRTDPLSKQTECANECGDYFWEKEISTVGPSAPATVDPNRPAYVTVTGKQIVCEPCMHFCKKCVSQDWCDLCDCIGDKCYVAKNSSQVKNTCKVKCPDQGFFGT